MHMSELLISSIWHRKVDGMPDGLQTNESVIAYDGKNMSKGINKATSTSDFVSRICHFVLGLSMKKSRVDLPFQTIRLFCMRMHHPLAAREGCEDIKPNWISSTHQNLPLLIFYFIICFEPESKPSKYRKIASQVRRI